MEVLRENLAQPSCVVPSPCGEGDVESQGGYVFRRFLRDLARLTLKCLMIRYNTVASFIFTYGLPQLFKAPFQKEKVTEEKLHSMLDEAMQWHGSLLLSIVEHEKHPNMEQARKLASLDHKAWRLEQQEAKRQAKDALLQSERLATDFLEKKRKYEDMSPEEKQILKDYEGTAQQNYEAACRPWKKVPHFSGVLYKSDATASEARYSYKSGITG